MGRELTAGRSERELGAARLDVLEALVSRLIPSDETGPGAAEAQVARYISGALDGDYRHHLGSYDSSLGAIDDHAEATLGSPFATLAPEQQDAILADLEQGLVSGCSPSSAAFFELVRRHALEGMFGDPGWGGNAGRIGWDLIGYPGPRYVWTASEQRIVDRERAG